MNISIHPTYSFKFDFERDFDKQNKQKWMSENWQQSFYFSIAYVVIIFGLQKYMATRERKTLKRVLIAWNFALAVFSITGLVRYAPEFLHSLTNFGFTHSVCNPSFIEDNEVSGLWTWFFTISKVPELGDTIFIVLRKSDLIFLHWYHHITVLIFTWYSYWQHIAPARWYIFMNYLAHSCMYSYYFLRANGVKVKSAIAMCITLLQLLQMVGGLVVTAWSMSVLYSGKVCAMNYPTGALAIAMYTSYFVLFFKYFIKTYSRSKAMAKKDK